GERPVQLGGWVSSMSRIDVRLEDSLIRHHEFARLALKVPEDCLLVEGCPQKGRADRERGSSGWHEGTHDRGTRTRGGGRGRQDLGGLPRGLPPRALAVHLREGHAEARAAGAPATPFPA